MSSTSSFAIQACSPSDIDRDFAVINAAFGTWAPFIEFFFPNHETPAGTAQGVERLKAWQKSDEHAHFVQAVSTSSTTTAPNEGILGFAIWTFMSEPPSETLDDVEDVDKVWGQLKNGQEHADFARQVWHSYVQPRRNAIMESQGKGCFVLEMLAVHPDAQGKGVGEALVRWGLQNADEKGAEAVVESTRNARKLYEKCGMKTTIPTMAIDVDKKFASWSKPDILFLRQWA